MKRSLSGSWVRSSMFMETMYPTGSIRPSRVAAFLAKKYR